jgi:hypothetical protein
MGRKMAKMVEYEEKRRQEGNPVNRPEILDDQRLKGSAEGRQNFVIERLLQYVVYKVIKDNIYKNKMDQT